MKNFHLAGIIPVHKADFSFGFDWPDCMMPIGSNLTAIERSVMECAWAGCETIWIVCNDNISPIIRHRIGEMVQDPVWLRKLDTYPSASRKPVPIFYVPIHPKDLGKVDCYSWAVLHGAMTVFKISSKISKWLIPGRYYVSFPYSVYDPAVLRTHRKEISSSKPFYLKSGDKTIKDGELLGFTFDKNDFVNFRRVIRGGTGIYKPTDDGSRPTERLPAKHRYSARHFTLEKVFGGADLNNSNIVAVPWYYKINNWQSYTEYIKSSNQLERPSKLFLSYREWNEMGVDRDE